MAYPTSPAPNHVRDLKPEYLVDTEKAEDGTEYTRLRNSTMLGAWELEYSQLSAADQSTMLTWWQGIKGSYQTDTVTHAAIGTAVKVRCTGFQFSPGAYPRKNLKVTLKQAV